MILILFRKDQMSSLLPWNSHGSAVDSVAKVSIFIPDIESSTLKVCAV